MKTVKPVWTTDAAWLTVSVLLATKRVFGVWMPWLASTPSGTLMPSVGLVMIGAFVAVYVTHRAADVGNAPVTYGQILGMVGIAVSVTAIGLVVSREYWSREWLLLVYGAWTLFMLAMLFVYRFLVAPQPMVVITEEKSLADGIAATRDAHVIAVVGPQAEPSMIPVGADTTLVVDLRSVLSEEMARFVSSASLGGMNVRPLVDVYEQYTGRLPIIHLVDGWELTRPISRSRYAPVKRAVELIVVVVTAPVWIFLGLVVAIGAAVASGRPLLYRQSRVGRHGREFTLWKFRSMVANAEAQGPQFTAPNDSRITGIGRFLRRTRLDELPQLWNVLVGDLALVGPRPERAVFVERFSSVIPYYASRHLIRPGLTGWAQVHTGYGDDEADAFDKLTYDLYYVKHSSLWLDIRILALSIGTVLKGSGSR